ncbi:MAG: hypothetical protein M1830_000472 [Pleopsidium flavum]|nr:MAG: hypothetical protein M1830_000472 [Pleopsidium flavum]
MKGLCPNFDYSDGNYQKCYLSARGVMYLAQRGIFLEVSEEFIEDKSKADALAKALVCLQVTWTVIQVISKKIVGYPIALLEVHTLGHVACALALYALWFQKPLGVREPTIVEKEEFREHLPVFLAATHTIDQDHLETPRLLGSYITQLNYTIITKHLQSHTSTPRKLAVVLAVVCTTGAIHISAWNFVFPSKTEKLLWRICSLTTAAVPVFVISVFLLTMCCLNSLLRYPRLRRYIKTVHSFISTYMPLMLGLVVHCRAFLIVESFISIRHVPIGVYASVSWTKYIPHL